MKLLLSLALPFSPINLWSLKVWRRWSIRSRQFSLLCWKLSPIFTPVSSGPMSLPGGGEGVPRFWPGGGWTGPRSGQGYHPLPLPRPSARHGRYSSCGYAGVLSCFDISFRYYLCLNKYKKHFWRIRKIANLILSFDRSVKRQQFLKLVMDLLKYDGSTNAVRTDGSNIIHCCHHHSVGTGCYGFFGIFVRWELCN